MTKNVNKNTFFVQIQLIRQPRIVKLTHLGIVTVEVISQLTHKNKEGDSVVTKNRQIVAKGQGWRLCLGQDSDGRSGDCGNNGSGSRDGKVDGQRGGRGSWDQFHLYPLARDP